MSLKENTSQIFLEVNKVCQQVGRPQESVKVIAVTKYVDSSITKQLIDSGVRHLGENRVEAFLAKKEVLKDADVIWHFIGSLQRRKVKDVINEVDYFHGLDSLKLAQEIEKRAQHQINCFIQVNISGEESKHGFSESGLITILPELTKLKKINFVGLMTMAPLEATPDEISKIFTQTEVIRKSLQKMALPNMPMTETSMGMSQDYSLAIAAGATYVRIGTAFFK